MKTNTRSIPLDMISVSEGTHRFHICTHRQQISVEVVGYDDTAKVNTYDIAMIPFDQFHKALRRICQEAVEAPETPSPLSDTSQPTKTPTAPTVEAGKAIL